MFSIISLKSRSVCVISCNLFSDTTAITIYFSVSIKSFMFDLVILGKKPNLSELIHLFNVTFKLSLFCINSFVAENIHKHINWSHKKNQMHYKRNKFYFLNMRQFLIPNTLTLKVKNFFFLIYKHSSLIWGFQVTFSYFMRQGIKPTVCLIFLSMYCK